MKKKYIEPVSELFYFEPESMIADSSGSRDDGSLPFAGAENGYQSGDNAMTKKKDWNNDSPWN